MRPVCRGLLHQYHHRYHLLFENAIIPYYINNVSDQYYISLIKRAQPGILHMRYMIELYDMKYPIIQSDIRQQGAFPLYIIIFRTHSNTSIAVEAIDL